jgi:hypothetical protein
MCPVHFILLSFALENLLAWNIRALVGKAENLESDEQGFETKTISLITVRSI